MAGTAATPATLDMQATEGGPASPEMPAIAGRPAKVLKSGTDRYQQMQGC